jgi:hypothetical protein
MFHVRPLHAILQHDILILHKHSQTDTHPIHIALSIAIAIALFLDIDNMTTITKQDSAVGMRHGSLSNSG